MIIAIFFWRNPNFSKTKSPTPLDNGKFLDLIFVSSCFCFTKEGWSTLGSFRKCPTIKEDLYLKDLSIWHLMRSLFFLELLLVQQNTERTLFETARFSNSNSKVARTSESWLFFCSINCKIGSLSWEHFGFLLVFSGFSWIDWNITALKLQQSGIILEKKFNRERYGSFTFPFWICLPFSKKMFQSYFSAVLRSIFRVLTRKNSLRIEVSSINST